MFPAVPVLAEVRIVDAYARYIDESPLKRIGEFLTGRVSYSGTIVLRSQKDIRAGQYFIITLDKKARNLPPDTKIEITVISTASPNPRPFTFPIGEKGSNTRHIYAGLTGSDWPGRDVRPLAWKISIVNASGKTLAVKESFLWRSP